MSEFITEILRRGGDGLCPVGKCTYDTQLMLKWLVGAELEILIGVRLFPVHPELESSISHDYDFAVQHRDLPILPLFHCKLDATVDVVHMVQYDVRELLHHPQSFGCKKILPAIGVCAGQAVSCWNPLGP